MPSLQRSRAVPSFTDSGFALSPSLVAVFGSRHNGGIAKWTR
jgi:hypothetical protein